MIDFLDQFWEMCDENKSYEENKTKSLINELEIGEKSAKIKNFDRNKNLEQLKANFGK